MAYPMQPQPSYHMQAQPSYSMQFHGSQPMHSMQPMQPMQPVQMLPMQHSSSRTVVYASPVSMSHSVQTLSSPAPQVMLSPMCVQSPSGPMMGSMPSTPCPSRCPGCGQQVVSRVVNSVGTITWAWAIALLLIIPFGCCFIPFFVPGCKDQQHFCPHCNALLGTRQSC